MTQPLVEQITRKYLKKGEHKAVRPVDASSIVLVDRRGASPRILMGKRNPAAKFMPGFFVFPGGRVEKTDGDVPHAGALDPADMDRLRQFVTRPSDRRLRGIALAAIRETFEETGLRLGAPADGAPATHLDPSWAAFLAGGQIPTLRGLRYAARAITPPGRNRRFDTRFFLRDVSSLQDMATVRPTPESELVELVWVTPDEALKLESAEITQILLAEIRTLAEAGFPADMPRPMFRARYKKFERVSL